MPWRPHHRLAFPGRARTRLAFPVVSARRAGRGGRYRGAADCARAGSAEPGWCGHDSGDRDCRAARDRRRGGVLRPDAGGRVRPAGGQILESRLTRLPYAPEITQAMLRQQQATAVAGARLQTVQGAAGMARLARRRPDQEGIIELDQEPKAAMVSSLLAVLGSEQATQQVVSTGSLYQ